MAEFRGWFQGRSIQRLGKRTEFWVGEVVELYAFLACYSEEDPGWLYEPRMVESLSCKWVWVH